MQDRIPLYPGRVKMTPVAGQANTFDMVRADDPTQAGTPLNKATLLKDATAALYGLGTGAVPDDVLAELGKYKQYWWRRRSINSGWYQVDTAATNRLLKDDIHDTVVYTYGDSISVSKTNGTITINSPSSMTLRRSTVTVDKLAVLKGKYFKTDVNQEVGSSNIHIVAGDIYFVPADTSITNSYDSDSGSTYYYTSELTHVTTEYRSTIGNWQYVHSSNRSAYPDSGTQDGYKYEYLGIPFDNAVTAPKIETGSYVGTGTYGQGNPNTLTFEFVPKFVIFIDNGYYNGSKTIYMALFQKARNLINCELLPDSYGDSAYFLGPSGYSRQQYTDWKEAAWKTNGGKTINWLSTNSAVYQFNEINNTYYYIAIG